jgi:periplasmic protein TonB
VHVGAVAALLWTARSNSTSLQPSYAVELVASAPTAGRARPTPETPPAPAPAPVVPKAVPKPVLKPAKPVAKAPTKPVQQSVGKVTPLPGETPKGGNDIANVKTQGKEFPYPEYLRNLVTQIYRRWNRPSGNDALEAEVAFVILRDGSVRDIKILRSSRSYSFDEEAQGAIEATAVAKAFGPLPAGYPADYLPISFSFTPRQIP